jgi:hypothetical protein
VPAVYPDCAKLDGMRGKCGILMETVGRRVEFEWQLIKGSRIAGTSAKHQCRVSPPGPADSPIKAQSSQCACYCIRRTMEYVGRKTQ